MIKLGLYGCGNRTKALLDSLRYDDLYGVAASYDTNPAAMAQIQKEYGGKICSSPDELIESSQVDAFIISLDPFAHAQALRDTMKAGKPVFIEKPVSFSSSEVYELAQAAEKYKVPVHVGFMRRYLPYHAAGVKFMQENNPGHIFSINCNWFHPGETEMINFLRNAPDNFRLKVSQIPFHCCHALDVMLQYGGMVKKVSAEMVKIIDRRYPSPDELIAILEFKNGAIGRFHYSSMSYSQEISYQIHSENYTLKINGNLEIYRRPEYETQRKGSGTDCRPSYHAHMTPEIRTYGDMSVTEKIMFDFISSVQQGTPMKVTLMDAFRVAELAEAIESSAANRKPVFLSGDDR